MLPDFTKLYENKSKSENQSRRLEDFVSNDGFYYKHPRNNKLENLINEFLAMRIAITFAKEANYEVIIPTVDIVLSPETHEPCLKITMVPGYKNLEELETLDNSYKNALLQCLIIDIITGNNDGHVKNIGINNANKLSHIDFGQAFILDTPFIGDDVAKIAEDCKDGFAQRSLFPAAKSELQKMLKKLLTISDLKDALFTSLVTAAAELKILLKSDVDLIENKLKTANEYFSNQLSKIGDIEDFQYELSIPPLDPKTKLAFQIEKSKIENNSSELAAVPIIATNFNTITGTPKKHKTEEAYGDKLVDTSSFCSPKKLKSSEFPKTDKQNIEIKEPLKIK